MTIVPGCWNEGRQRGVSNIGGQAERASVRRGDDWATIGANWMFVGERRAKEGRESELRMDDGRW